MISDFTLSVVKMKPSAGDSLQFPNALRLCNLFISYVFVDVKNPVVTSVHPDM